MRIVRDYKLKQAIREAEALKSRLERERRDRPRRKISAVEISHDHGRTWIRRAACSVCVDEHEPPARVRALGGTGAMSCDLCGALHQEFC